MSLSPEDRVARIAAAKQERKDLYAWARDGAVGERPATPNLDSIDADAAERKANGGRRGRRASNVRFAVNGVVQMAKGKNTSFGVLTAMHSGDDNVGVARYTAVGFAAVLAQLGVADPYAAGWMVTLPNGKVVECLGLDDPPKSPVIEPSGEAVTKAQKAAATRAAKKAAAAA